MPRDRAGAFHTQVFERYSRYEPEVAEALTDMFVSGTSTKTSGQSGGKTAGSGWKPPVPSAGSTRRLSEQYEAWRQRRLLPHYRLIYAGRPSTSRCAMGAKPMRP